MASNENDELFAFAEETASPPSAAPELPARADWRVLIVDDEPHVHTITKLVLESLHIDGAALSFDDAYSGDEARQLLRQHRYALVLLDVVMSTDDDGLRLAHWLRREHGDHVTRIVLRTGQPGLAPEREIMLEYDINDYQPKAELSAQRLATAVIGAIRSYRDVRTIEEQKAGLEQIVLATSSLFERRSVEQLLSGVLQQLTALIGPPASAIFFVGARDASTEPVVLAGTGRFAPLVGRHASAALPHPIGAEIASLVARHTSATGTTWSLHSISRRAHEGALAAAVYLEPGGSLDPWQQRLLELFCSNAAVAFDNQTLIAEQAELVQAFGRFVPQRILDAIGVRDIARVAVGDQVQRDMTVMFVDVRAFTPLAEHCGPKETFRVLNRLFAELVPIVHAHRGVVDKYLGDGLLALFPDPGDGPVHAALEMLRATDRLSELERARIGGPLDVGIGIHRGPTILGLVGAQDRLESTVISDAVNVASRLERLTRSLGARLIASTAIVPPESSLRARARSLGRQVVRGKSELVECFDVFAADPANRQSSKEATRAAFEAAVRALDAGRLDEARRGFSEVARLDPGDLAALERAGP